mmetsp:Transcript_18776/g.46034  ORF Transcript_18776/g.46034 Transcript_18776/m.46034 type:complete len:459 (-) Transcript_18776:126-1502(-)
MPEHSSSRQKRWWREMATSNSLEFPEIFLPYSRSASASSVEEKMLNLSHTPETEWGSWANLPTEIIRKAAVYADAVTLVRLSQTCSSFHSRLNEAFWRDIFLVKHGNQYRTDLIRPIGLPGIRSSWWNKTLRDFLGPLTKLVPAGRQHPSPVIVAPVWRTACLIKAKSRSSQSRHLQEYDVDLRQCRICNRLDALSGANLRFESDPHTVRHSTSVWIRPCKCNAWCHRKCFEQMWAARSNPLAAVLGADEDALRCSNCDTPYGIKKRKTTLRELFAFTLGDLFFQGPWRILSFYGLQFMSILLMFTLYQNVRASWWTLIFVSPPVKPSAVSICFCLTYQQMVMVFLSPRFQTAILRIFPGPLYKNYLKLYGSILLAFLLFVFTFCENPFLDPKKLPIVVRILSWIAAAWWFVASMAIILIFWSTAHLADTPADRGLTANLHVTQGRCPMCAIGLCASS